MKLLELLKYCTLTLIIILILVIPLVCLMIKLLNILHDKEVYDEKDKTTTIIDTTIDTTDDNDDTYGLPKD